MAATLDTLQLAKRLKAVAFTDEQAELVAEVMRESREAGAAELATKADIALLRADFDAFRVEARADMAALRSEMRADMAALRSEMRADMAAMRAEMQLLEQRMTIKLGGMLAASIVIVGALAALL